MKKPFITLKFAQTLDARIAGRDSSSKWISSPASRKFTHKLRAKSDGILVGARTVLADDPSLTARLVKGKNPSRIVLDGRLHIPLTARVVKKGTGTIVFTSFRAPKRKIKRLREEGVEVIVLPSSKDGNIDLKKIIRILYRKGIRSVLVEGGRSVITSFLKAALADRIVAVISPKILGKGIETVGDLGIRNIKDAFRLRLKNVKRLGKDIIYEASL